VNHYLAGILIGVAAYYLGERFLMSQLRRHFDPDHKKALTKNVFRKMDYDTLRNFRDAVEAEIAKRRAP
jgi:hypothetical protein